MKHYYLFILLIFLVGCGNIDYLGKGNVKNVTNVSMTNTSTNSTNVTFTPPAYPELVNGTTYIVSANSLLIIYNDLATIIDAGDYMPIEALNYYNLKPKGFILTTDRMDKIQFAKYYVNSMKPEVIYDKGVDTEFRRDYLKYSDKFNLVSHTVNVETTSIVGNMYIDLFPTFEDGLFMNNDWNVLVVKAEDLLYMSTCYGDCEKKIDEKAKYLVLANNGKCPTNSMDFIINSGAKVIIGTELCKDLEDLKYFDVTFMPINKFTVLS